MVSAAAVVVAVLAVVMLVDGQIERSRLATAASVLVACLAVVGRGVPLRRWRFPLVVAGALSSGAFAVALVGHCGRVLSPERPQIASPGAGFAWALVALWVGVAVVPIAALLLAKVTRRS